jgi:glycosyltransferase involved in cell wall biosynthesis
MTERLVVHVMFADGDGHAPVDVLDRWPTVPQVTAALAEHGGFRVVVVARTRSSDCRLERDGVTWHFVHDPSRLGTRIATRVRSLRPDVVHVHGLVFPLPTLLLRARVGRRPRLVAQHHGGAPGEGRARWAQRAASWVIDGYLFTGVDGQVGPWRAAGVLRPTSHVYEALESSSDLEPVSYHEARQRTGQIGSPAVLWVGRLNDGKDPLTAVEAFRQFAAKAPDAHLWMIYTEAALEPEVRSAAEPMGDRIHLMGAVPHHDMAAWFSGSDIMFSASRHEGSGYALVEALACGCTPVVTDIGPHRVIVGNLGQRFPVGDAVAAAHALNDVEVPQRDDVKRDFDRRLSWRAVAIQLVAAYD